MVGIIVASRILSFKIVLIIKSWGVGRKFEKSKKRELEMALLENMSLIVKKERQHR